MRRFSLLGPCVVTLAMSVMCFAQVPSLTLLGIPTDRASSSATAISADGRVVVGTNRLNGGGNVAFSWTASGGMNEFGSSPGVPLYTFANGVSGNGSVIVGERRSFTVPEQANAFRYVNGTYQALPAPAGFALGSAQGVSADASVIVGITSTSGTAPSRPARWNQAGTPQAISLPRVGDIGGWFTGVSRDGRVAIGISGGSTAAQFDPFTWTEADGWRQLPVPSAFGTNYTARTNGTNFDGDLVVGHVSGVAFPNTALLWRNGQVSSLGTFGERWSMIAGSVSDTGMLITGSGLNLDTQQSFATIWLDGAGPIMLQDYLASLGVSTPSGWWLSSCGRIAADGRTFLGLATDGSRTQGFVATIPTPSIPSLFMMTLLVIAPRRRSFRMRPSILLGTFLATMTACAVCAAQTPSLTLIGLPAGRSDSFVTGLSDDGGTVVGYNRLTEGGDRAYVWSRIGGMNEFGSTPGIPTQTRAQAVSSDGAVIVGERRGAAVAEAFRYTNGSYQNFPTPVGNDHAAALGLSGNAGVMVGAVGSGTGPSRPLRWTQAIGSQSLALPRAGDNGGWFTGISRDGSTAIGISGGSTAAQFDPFTWTEAGGWRQLPVPASVGSRYDARPVSVNGDGSRVVGNITSTTGPSLAVLWQNQTVVNLGTLGSRWSMFTGGVSDDGSVITGSAHNGDTELNTAVIWLGGSGPIVLQDYLASFGVTVPSGWTLAGCGAVTPDGQTFIGVAQRASNYQAFVATIPAPSIASLAMMSVLVIAPRRRRSA